MRRQLRASVTGWQHIPVGQTTPLIPPAVTQGIILPGAGSAQQCDSPAPLQEKQKEMAKINDKC